eukprot:scaffold112_cov282-Prasinococcus_capsulatus_cf.AAC.20
MEANFEDAQKCLAVARRCEALYQHMCVLMCGGMVAAGPRCSLVRLIVYCFDRALEGGDIEKALKFVSKAQKLYPSVEGEALLRKAREAAKACPHVELSNGKIVIS